MLVFILQINNNNKKTQAREQLSKPVSSESSQKLSVKESAPWANQ